MEQNLQLTILKSFIHDEKFCRAALPHVKPEYFQGEYKIVYELLLDFIGKYNKLPNKTILEIEFNKSDAVTKPNATEALKIIRDIDNFEIVEYDWIVNSTEKWCKDRAVHIAIMESISIIDGRNEKASEGMIPDILSKALSVTFDTNVGHDYVESAEERYEYYHKKENKISFDLDIFNKITNGGITRKTLNFFLAGPYVGKSLALCHLSAAYLSMGYNVLYITLELAEERIAERIDANLMNTSLDDIVKIEHADFTNKISGIASKTQGRLIIKEYPTGAAHVGHFRALLQELKMKKNFIPDIICVDYLNLCASQRMKGLSGSVNSYSLVKATGEELRGFAVEQNVAIWTATQVNREGSKSSDFDMTDTSECIAIDQTVKLRDGSQTVIGNIDIGDQITANDGYKTVLVRHHNKMKECVKINLKSGKSIVVSKDHVFPTKDLDGIVNRRSVNTGLLTGMKLKSIIAG